ncbi:isochorismate synthase [Candidatus Nephthysia bennettiae]|uniref:isochorismate synthase n=1 Tax=Candidatus Nephthysia bennettiae TaxID=3127016 RepID=A0A934K1D3_9BACT|nr:isochorismate synthase [Candidatus Dormibacteraeota bacterium]MBJ7612213.1 isochorismate synthase [Candidatus Dormibacteraeota bacterium]
MRPVELEGTPDLVELASAARDAGHEVTLIERPMPDAVSLVGIGRRLDLVSNSSGVALEDERGNQLDEEPGLDRLAAAGRLWDRVAASTRDSGPGVPGTGLVALGGFAFEPGREPAGPWGGFPGLLFRIPALTVTRVRGRSFASGDLALLELTAAFRARGARQFEVEPVRPEASWLGAVESAVARLRAGEADKVVLAREVIARGDGVVAAGPVARSLRSAYPACFTYLLCGADGTALVGASPELLVRRSGSRATCQPMAGSIARGRDEPEDEALAAALRESAKDSEEHLLTATAVAESLAGASLAVEQGAPEVVRFTNIQHLASTIRAELRQPPPNLLDLAALLHPTPAVNGSPRPAACRLIRELEEMERGWYAGAVGWIDGRGDGELAVAIRCGLLWADGARLYAGVGLMPDSEPAVELRETEIKLRALLGALIG